MKFEKTRLDGVLSITPQVFGDARGNFFETWQVKKYADVGIAFPFVQDNVSRSTKGVLRGLHFQNPNAQGKLVSVLFGSVFDVAVDVRQNSPKFGEWHGEILSSENSKQLWIPQGFAHGFYVTSDFAVFAYKCTEFYDPKSEVSLFWNDPKIGVSWPEGEKIVSAKDSIGLRLAELPSIKLTFNQGSK
jgi:dTDP-4-dehydrorhamnose 3,5-epimerase